MFIRCLDCLCASFSPLTGIKAGCTPLHWGAQYGHLAVVVALVAAGADIGAKGNVSICEGVVRVHLMDRMMDRVMSVRLYRCMGVYACVWDIRRRDG
jgi:Ankyrin repeat